MEISTNYSYKPLRPGEIRLFALWPGSGTQPLKGQLIHHPRGDTDAERPSTSTAVWFKEKYLGVASILNNSPSSLHTQDSYEALSYTWGDSIKSAKIQLYTSRGAVTVGDMGITDNLEAALRRLRLSDQTRFLWIDVICINQEDLAERENQVLMMREIFEGAVQTIIWLGEENMAESQSDTSTTTKSALRCIEALRRPPADYPSSDAESWDLKALSRLLSRPWFSRVWVYQEVMVSKQLLMLCGAEKIGWGRLYRACLSVRDRNLDIGFRDHEPLYTSVLIMQEARESRSVITPKFERTGADAPTLWHDKSKGGRQSELQRKYQDAALPKLHVTLLSLRWAKATDPRDKVYALLGISSGFWRDELRPNYTLSLQRVYVKTAKTLSKMGGILNNLGFLSFVQHESRRLGEDDLPTWVPDWRTELHAPWLLVNSDCRVTWRDDAMTGKSPLVRFPFPNADEQGLGVRGVSLMTIAVLGSQGGVKAGTPGSEIMKYLPNPYNDSWEAAFPEGLGDGDEVFQGRSALLTRCRCQVPFWSWKRQCDERGFQGFEDISETVGRDFELLGLPGRIGPDEVDWEKVDMHANRGIAYGRRLFVSDLGFIGLAPLASVIGDEVCLLAGGDVPFVVRREAVGSDENSAPRCRFVGECYVFGLDGEFLGKEGAGQLKEMVLL
ncbi:heterokaryon incompatibility protein-domain-containing protein [Podospora didyma]|uniref:Heterokaryon incompatibility protein-domain-containing protein n=1 Tax=Podospora didyma TaxID=330526 RepID=A0AAE0U0U9_9PEZI|nr:heterokaryon incompatibility protein-domain-containing protein [Podospora didyma]